jgi:hypothetical protein
LSAKADRHAELRRAAVTLLERLWHGIMELLCRLVSGALAGLIAGYGSHVMLDARTPAGIPLIA